MNKKSRLFFQLLILLNVFAFLAQEIPPVQNFSPKNYGGESQNWSISQADDGFIYAANNKGLLVYNGASWKLYETPNQTIMRSVKAYKDKIFTGFYMDFGYWKKNEFGNLKFLSIAKNQNVKMLEDEQIWDIIEIDGWMLFKSLDSIYLYNLETKEIKTIRVSNKIRKLSKVDDVLYFQEDFKGLFKIENGQPKLVTNSPIVLQNSIVEIFNKDNKLLILTAEKGFFILENDKLIKWQIPSYNLLKNKTIYCAKQLNNKSFAIGTISDGLFYFDKDGQYNYHLSQDMGLNNNTVLSIFEDRDYNIWLALDNGINCVNNSSPFKIYQKKSDYLGTIYTSIVYKNNMYLGTNQGLFYKKLNSAEPFQFIKNTQGQVWNLVKIDNTLFCGHDSGSFIIDDGKVVKSFETEGAWTFLKVNNETIIQGGYNGLLVLKKKGSNWLFNNKIKGFDISSRYVVQLDKNNFFISHEYKGVFKVTIDDNYKEVTNTVLEKSLKKGIYSSIINYNDKILYATKEGVFIYNKKANAFKRDSIYSNILIENEFISAKLIHNRTSDKIWLFSKNHLNYLSPGKFSAVPEINRIPISEKIPRAASGYENIIPLSEEKYLVGTSNAYLLVDLSEIKEYKDFNVHINKASFFETDQPKNDIDLSNNQSFEFVNNNLEFYYSVSNYDKINETIYQYQLIGFNKNWSKPTISNFVVFENLSYGKYTLKVRAFVGDKLSTNEAIFNFRIERPWYLSNAMIFIYIILSLTSFYVVHIVTRRYYRKQKEALIEKAKNEAELLELESSQKIIKLNNEKLRSDIESKNKELASSTMNLIKKNEFLSTIKAELIKGNEKSIPKVVKIIDKNLNNTDDWKMFQEAFNNADKNFLKKIKEKHSELTPNDLRLCAYLRLNLSSKEIAPLLNISPRSVEVKRYRLRKKMNLEHDSNLTNYILEI